jgi:putative restriction endonuclease
MRFWVGVTDGDWYRALSAQPGIDEVNFWQPSGGREFRTLAPGDLFLFKLHAPVNAIVGGGVFAHWTRLPASLAWEAFGPKNGAATLAEMRRRIERYRRGAATPGHHEDYQVGCILLEQPFFFPEALWVPAPDDWKPNIVQGKTYATDTVAGRNTWDRVQRALQACAPAHELVALPAGADIQAPTAEPAARWGKPILIHPRLGQGSFRVLVTDTYERRCAITRERTLPALEAAHIRPYADHGEHRVDNGLLLRRDLHALFDAGYLTVTPELKVEVSKRIREEFDNGKDYYAMAGTKLWVPPETERRPNPEFLRWHNEGRYLG